MCLNYKWISSGSLCGKYALVFNAEALVCGGAIRLRLCTSGISLPAFISYTGLSLSSMYRYTDDAPFVQAESRRSLLIMPRRSQTRLRFWFQNRCKGAIIFSFTTAVV